MDFSSINEWIVEINTFLTAIITLIGYINFERLCVIAKKSYNYINPFIFKKTHLKIVKELDIIQLAELEKLKIKNNSDLNLLENENKNLKIQIIKIEKENIVLKNNLSNTVEDLKETFRERFKFEKLAEDLKKQLSEKNITYYKDNILCCNDKEICSQCFDNSPISNRKFIRLLIGNSEIKGIFYCPTCKTRYKTPEGSLQERAREKTALQQISTRYY